MSGIDGVGWYDKKMVQAERQKLGGQEWVKVTAHNQYLERTQAGAGGTPEEDWLFAERQLDFMAESDLLCNRLHQSVNVFEKIAMATVYYLTRLSDLKPSEVVDVSPLSKTIPLNNGISQSTFCGLITVSTRACKLLKWPDNSTTVGALIAGFQKQCLQ
jgi:hypothetical protein